MGSLHTLTFSYVPQLTASKTRPNRCYAVHESSLGYMFLNLSGFGLVQVRQSGFSPSSNLPQIRPIMVSAPTIIITNTVSVTYARYLCTLLLFLLTQPRTNKGTILLLAFLWSPHVTIFVQLVTVISFFNHVEICWVVQAHVLV